jgi:hypothetical protein
MREISKYGRICCQQNHNKWAELVPHVDMWLNNAVASTALDAPVEFMFAPRKPNISEKLMSR